MKLRYLFAVLSAVVVAEAASAQVVPPPLEAYGNLPLISSAELSPDGTKIAGIFNIDGMTAVQVLNLQGGAVSAARIDEFKARQLRFFDDEHVLLLGSDTRTFFGYRGEYEYSASFALNFSTGKFAQIPDRVKDMSIQTGLGFVVGEAKKDGWVLSPAFMQPNGSYATRDLLRVELKSGRGSREARGTEDTIDWFTGKGGKVLARERYSNKTDRYLVQAANEWGGWTSIFEKKESIRELGMAGVMPDESGLVFVEVDTSAGGFNRLMKLGFDGEISGPVLAREGVEIDYVITDRNRAVLGVIYAGLEPDYEFLDERLGAAYAAIQEALPLATIYMDSWSDDRSVILYRVFEPTIGDVWLTQRPETNTLEIFAKTRPDISGEHIGSLYAIRYEAADGLSIPAIVTLPAGQSFDAVQNAPTIVFPHGGPASYDRFSFDWMAQYFASRGYLVLQPNFRGSTGFGEDFENAGIGEFGGKMLSDIDDGLAALIDTGRADPDRVCIVGGSYGGYAALGGATFTPDRYACAIAIAPVTDLRKMLIQVQRDTRASHWVRDYWANVMSGGEVSDEQLNAISPAQHADRIQAPVLLIHGEDDTIVDIDQSLEMVAAMERAGKPFEFVRLEGEDHWLSVAETRLQTLQAMDAFLAQHMPAGPVQTAPVATD